MRRILAVLAFSLIAMSATCQTSHSAIVSWTASATPNATYNLFKASSQSGPFTLLQGGIAGLTFTDANLPPNTQVCYQATTSAPGFADSDPSNTVCGTTGQDKASAPGALILVVK